VLLEQVEELGDALGAAGGEHVVERLEPLARLDAVQLGELVGRQSPDDPRRRRHAGVSSAP
jgi:hypothetical protein